ncbi:MAG: hypothetical protein V4858_27515 [Pseudomonadota bacterium]
MQHHTTIAMGQSEVAQLDAYPVLWGWRDKATTPLKPFSAR